MSFDLHGDLVFAAVSACWAHLCPKSLDADVRTARDGNENWTDPKKKASSSFGFLSRIPAASSFLSSFPADFAHSVLGQARPQLGGGFFTFHGC